VQSICWSARRRISHPKTRKANDSVGRCVLALNELALCDRSIRLFVIKSFLPLNDFHEGCICKNTESRLQASPRNRQVPREQSGILGMVSPAGAFELHLPRPADLARYY